MTCISIQTSFDWRQKFLTSPDSVYVEEFQVIVESDDLFFAYSEKRNRNLDRPAKKRGEKAGKRGISNEKITVVATCDRPKFNASKGQRAVEKIYHVQNVNDMMDMRLRRFLASFNAFITKYLQNYMNWFLVLEKIKNSTTGFITVATIAFTSNTAWMEFNNIALNRILFRT